MCADTFQGMCRCNIQDFEPPREKSRVILNVVFDWGKEMTFVSSYRELRKIKDAKKGGSNE